MGFGIALVLLAGIMAGNFMLPAKHIRRWKWENVWLLFNVVSLVLAPGALALACVRDLGRVYAETPGADLLRPLLFGAGWGVSQVLFGVVTMRLGMSLAYGVILGLSALLGSLVPLLLSGSQVGSQKAAVLGAGMLLMVAGIAAGSWAGLQRERATVRTQPVLRGGSYWLNLALALLTGALGPMLNYALAFGEPIRTRAISAGTSAAVSSYAVWPVALVGGFAVNLAYCVWLLSRNRSWSAFRAGVFDAGVAVAMGVLWMTAIALYGLGTTYLGPLGVSLGWALYLSFTIMAANVSGLFSGEWSGAKPRLLRALGGSLALLVSAATLIGIANSIR